MRSRSETRPDGRPTDRAALERGSAVPCRICERIFGRRRLAAHSCACCEQAFCGEHGGVALGGRGSCVECGGHG